MPDPSWIYGGHADYPYTGAGDTFTLPAELVGYLCAVWVGGAGGSGDGRRRYVEPLDPADTGSAVALLFAGDPRYGTTVAVQVGGDSSGLVGGWPNGGPGGLGASGVGDGTGGGGATKLGALATIAGTGGASGTPATIYTVEQPIGGGGTVTRSSNARAVRGGNDLATVDDGGRNSIPLLDYQQGGNGGGSEGVGADAGGFFGTAGGDGSAGVGGTGGDARTLAGGGPPVTTAGPGPGVTFIDWSGTVDGNEGVGGGGGGGGDTGGGGGAGTGGATGLYLAPQVQFPDPGYPGPLLARFDVYEFLLAWGGGGDGAGTRGLPVLDGPGVGSLAVEWWYIPLTTRAGWSVGHVGF